MAAMTDFFEPLHNTKPYFKMALQGFAGCGKTYTAAQVAVGLHQHIGSTKPIVIFDTEESAKFLQPLFSEHGIEGMRKPSRSLADLKTTMQTMVDGYGEILIIDSITHVWADFLEAYKGRKKYNKTTLEFQDWGIIKPTWQREFSDPFVRLPIHILMTGRAGYEYDNEVNEQTGKREIFKSGVKMKVEGDTAYEPDMLVLMERFEEIMDKSKRRVWREATVLKDRSTLLDGKSFRNPSFDDFKPAIERMLANPAPRQATPTTGAGELIEIEEQRSFVRRDREIMAEEIAELLKKHHPSQREEDKKARADLLERVFHTRSWTKVEGLGLDALRAGYAQLLQILEPPVPVDADPNMQMPEW